MPAANQLALILYFFQIVKEQKTANDRKRSNLNRHAASGAGAIRSGLTFQPMGDAGNGGG